MKILISAFLLSATLAMPAMAAVTLITGTGDPASTVTGGATATFEDVSTGQHSNLETAGITFDAEPGTMFDISQAYAGQFNNSGASLQGSFDDNAFQSLTFGFSAPVQALAFNYGGADTNWLLEAFDSAGASLGVVTLLPTHATNEGTYYGIASSSQNIARAVLSVDFANYDESTLHPDYVFLDNVTTGQFAAPVPEPGEWAMIVAGLGIVGGVARRRRKAA